MLKTKPSFNLFHFHVNRWTYQLHFEKLTGHFWIAFAAVTFWWTVQHCVIGFVPDFRSNAARFVAFFPGVVIIVLIYARTRRLSALIVGHWIIDLSGVLMMSVF